MEKEQITPLGDKKTIIENMDENIKCPEKPVEYVDLYDKNNKKLGKSISRDEAHAEGLWHRTVHIYIVRETADNIQVMVHVRSEKKKQYAMKLDPVFGGHIKSGQDEHQAAIEEFKEETGVSPDSKKLKYLGFIKKDDPINAPNDREFNMIFTYHLSPEEEEKLHFDPEEIDSIKWLSLSEIKKDIQDNPGDWRTSIQELTQSIEVIKNKLNL